MRKSFLKFFAIIALGLFGLFTCANKLFAIPELCINGIIYDDKAPLAVVNGENVKPGGLVFGVEVVEITESGVVFRYEGSTFIKAIGQDCKKSLTLTKTFANSSQSSTYQSNFKIDYDLDSEMITRFAALAPVLVGLSLLLGVFMYVWILGFWLK